MKPSTRGNGRIFKRKNTSLVWCAYYLRGKEYRESTGHSDEKKALGFLKHRLKEVGADQLGLQSFVGPQQHRVAVNQLLDALEGDYRLRWKATPQFRSHLKHVREYFGHCRAVEVTAEMIDHYIQERQEADAAAGTINRSTQLLGQAYALAIERKQLVNAPKIRRLSESDNVRQGFFSDAEFRGVWGNLPDYLKDFALFGYLTGWRKGEITSLSWEELDGDVIRLRPENSKNGEGRALTLEGELAELIERRKAARRVKTATGITMAGLIFHHDGNAIVDFRKSWGTACKLANIGKKLFHDLRRTSVRNMIRAGVPEHVAMQVSGHKTHSMLQRYNIVNEHDQREALKKTQLYVKRAALKESRHVIAMAKAVGK